ncbi:uncharacterized protein B0T15DRAFT_510088 [Chaetomium strumarium]|uniref:C2H2-type domain-containing protein n=1 Tax=Chaetomium strumarium TaxID=1170767 RepID=A0AAJ0M2J7_9PEZI|nr:hypothetical protein B0T15DRAFT_510088 [Chaetomium strumarium]
MDPCLDLSGPWECPDWFSWEGNDLGRSIDSNPPNPGNVGLNEFGLDDPLPYAAAAAAALFEDDNLPCLFPDLPVFDESSISTDPRELQSPPLPGSFSTNGSSGSGYSPSSMETGFPSPWTPWETPCVSPDLLGLQSPHPYRRSPQGDFSNTPLYLQDPMTSIIHTELESVAYETPIELSGTSAFTQSSPQAAVPDTTLTMEDKPPNLTSRKWRLQTRPVKCPVCNKGHTYSTELNKHIAARHRDVAASIGVSIERYVCELCHQVCTRKDRLVRHLKNKHGIEPQKRRKRPGGLTKTKK